MANTSIYNGFDQFWKHVIARTGEMITIAEAYTDEKAVPKTTTVNGKALSNNITLTYNDVGAAAASHTHLYAGSATAGGPANSAKALLSGTNVKWTLDDSYDNNYAIQSDTAQLLFFDNDNNEHNISSCASQYIRVGEAKVADTVADKSNAQNFIGFDASVMADEDVDALGTDIALAVWESKNTIKMTTTEFLQVGYASGAGQLSTPRTLTIGNTGKTFNGTRNVSWSLSEIGAAAASHSHSYLPLSGGTMSGNINSPILAQGQWIQVVDKGLVKTTTAPASGQASATVSIKSSIGYWGIGTLGNYNNLYFFHAKDTDIAAGNNVYGVTYIDTNGGVHGAVWNDYAEFRISDCLEPGRVVCENGDDALSIAAKRLQPGASIISDTYGFAIGETDEAKCPIAVSGRVLAYGYEDRDEFKLNIGRPVCAGPNGTVSIMTDDEYKNYGYCAIGIISAVPDYEEWGTGKIKVNGRIWIKVV